MLSRAGQFMWMGRSTTMAALRLVTRVTLNQIRTFLSISKVDLKPSFLRVYLDLLESPHLNWGRNYQKPTRKNIKTLDMRLNLTNGTKVDCSSSPRANVLHGQISYKTPPNSFSIPSHFRRN